MGLRRLGGAALLVAALLGALLIARIDGVRIAGTAVPVPGAGVPQVGDCVAEVTGSLIIPSHSAFPPPTVSAATVGEVWVSFSDCTGQHVGEVVAVRSTPLPTISATGDDSDSQWCRDIAVDFQAKTTWRFRAADGDWWVPAISQRFVTVLSASTEPSWGACAVLAPGLELYSGSYVESPPDLPAPPPFGLCRTGEERDRWVSCASPHRVQEFGIAVQAGMSSREAVAACGELIKAMTGMPDINAGGVLKVQVVGGRAATGGNVGPAADATPDRGRCRLIAVGPNQLVGTLLGIGTGELPLA